jgi:small subunit ribosomal protein S18
MARDRERRGKDSKAADRRRTPKKKVSILNQDSIDWVDYKDVNLLRRFMSERAKIRARRVTGNDQQQQAAVARAIKVAREMALLPYSVRQVTQRSKGRRDRGDRGDRGDRDAPMEAMATEAEAADTEAVEEGLDNDEFGGDGAGAPETELAAEEE